MTDLVLTKTRFHAGIWEGILKGVTGAPPRLVLRHQNEDVAQAEVTEDAATHVVRARVPADRLTEGMQTFTISPEDGTEILASFAIVAGDVLDDDLRAEVGLLRAELDLLKRAFRKHCAEQDT